MDNAFGVISTPRSARFFCYFFSKFSYNFALIFMTHIKLIFFKSIRPCLKFILIPMNVYFFWHHLFKKSIF